MSSPDSDESRCVICQVSIGPADSGLCDDHKYDEQLNLSDPGATLDWSAMFEQWKK